MNSEHESHSDFRLLAYALGMVALLLPVLLWPLFWLGHENPSHSKELYRIWLLAASCLAVAAAVADSLLLRAHNTFSTLAAIGWPFAACMVAAASLFAPQGAFMLATLFALHMLRPGQRLYAGVRAAWLWVSWIRDLSAALALFLWPLVQGFG